jgi:hypothetical protein
MIICDSKHCSLVSNYQISNNPEVPNEFQKTVFVNYKNAFGSTKPSCIALFLQTNALRKLSGIVDKGWFTCFGLRWGLEVLTWAHC